MDAREIAAGLSEAQRGAVIGVEAEGNGAHFYQIHALASKGLMSLTSIPKLMGAKAYRLNNLGLEVRSILTENAG